MYKAYYDQIASACCTSLKGIWGDWKTLKDAKEYCDDDSDCRFVYDPNCDGIEPMVCTKGIGTIARSLRKECIHAKGKTINYFHIHDIFNIYHIINTAK